MGPLLLARLLDLNDVQEGVLNVAFKIADDQGLALLDFKDLRAILDAVAPFAGKKEAEEGTGNPQLDEIKRAVASYGNVTKQTVGTIQRALLVLENQGGEKFFGEPALELKDFMKTDRDGRGYVNILAADKLMGNPRLYATFLLWLLSELFEELPEVGDPEKPKLVFFFDEAHLLFDEAPKALLEKIEQVVRLVRSKGVGVYFVTQNPLDVPDKVLAQLGNRVQHALRAFTPRDQKAVQTAASTFRPNPNLDTAQVIMELGKGEALVSFLEREGHALDGRALHDPSALRPDGPDHAGRTRGDHGEKPGQGKIRHHDRHASPPTRSSASASRKRRRLRTRPSRDRAAASPTGSAAFSAPTASAAKR